MRRPDLARDLAFGLDATEFAQAMDLAPDEWQAQVLRSRADRILLNCCRQSGKPTITVPTYSVIR